MNLEFFVGLLTSIKYLGVFVALVVSVLYLLSASTKIRKFVYKQQYSGSEKLMMILFFGFLGILASEYGLKLTGAVVNARDYLVIFAGILGGPAVGIGAGVVSGVYRATGFFWPGWTGTMGYWSAIGCGLGTIGAGFLGAWLFKYRNINIRKITTKQIWLTVLATVLWEIVHLQIIVPLVSPLYTDRTFFGIEEALFKTLLFPMILINAVGIILLLFIIRDAIIKRELEIAEKELTEGKIGEEKIR